MLRITLFGLCAELMLGIVTGLGSVMSFCLLWLLMRFVVRMNVILGRLNMMSPLEIPIVIYCDANIGSRTTVQPCLMFYGWIGAVLWRPVHVFKTMGTCCLCFHNLSLSA